MSANQHLPASSGIADAAPGPSVALGQDPEVWTRFYEASCNLVIWQRELAPALQHYLVEFARHPVRLSLRAVLRPDQVSAELERQLPPRPGRDSLVADIELLVEMFACLFEQDQIGMRLEWLTRAMCPKFHVDRLPCRLVTTYTGPGTHWISPDAYTGRPEDAGDFGQLAAGEVALLKGDGWFGNEGRGIVHRSPPVEEGTGRLFLSLDLMH